MLFICVFFFLFSFLVYKLNSKQLHICGIRLFMILSNPRGEKYSSMWNKKSLIFWPAMWPHELVAWSINHKSSLHHSRFRKTVFLCIKQTNCPIVLLVTMYSNNGTSPFLTRCDRNKNIWRDFIVFSNATRDRWVLRILFLCYCRCLSCVHVTPRKKEKDHHAYNGSYSLCGQTERRTIIHHNARTTQLRLRLMRPLVCCDLASGRINVQHLAGANRHQQFGYTNRVSDSTVRFFKLWEDFWNKGTKPFWTSPNHFQIKIVCSHHNKLPAWIRSNLCDLSGHCKRS